MRSKEQAMNTSGFASQRRRPKRLCERNAAEADESCVQYEFDSTVFLTQKKRLRPLPYLAEFACGQHEKIDIPFLKEATGLLHSQSDLPANNIPTIITHPSNDAIEKEQSSEPVGIQVANPLEDASLTLLTKHQHEQYLSLLLKKPDLLTGPGKGHSKNWKRYAGELQYLEAILQTERQNYKNAIESFREKNAHRFLAGFRHDNETLPAGAHPFYKIMKEPLKRIQKWRNLWTNATSTKDQIISDPNDSYLYYGPCSQTIALEAERLQASDEDIIFPKDDSSLPGQKEESLQGRMDMDGFRARVLLERNQGQDFTKVIGLDHKLTTDNTVASIPLLSQFSTSSISSGDTTSTACLLQHDEYAKKLAREHNVSVLMTSEAFSTMLNRPGNTLSRWKILIFLEQNSTEGTSSKNITTEKPLVFFEDPLPHVCTPREWMSLAYEGPLDAYLLSSSCSDGEYSATAKQQEEGASGNIQYVYTLVNLPTSNQNANTQVLVRVVNTRVDEDRRPIRQKIKLEYFHSDFGYLEEYTAFERVQWIMEKLLQPTCRVVVGRVNAINGTLISLEETNIALALAFGDSSFDPMSHFRVVGNIVKGSTLLFGGSAARYMICFPACFPSCTTSSASIHPSCARRHENEPTISLESELLAAETVSLNRDSLLRCFRMFEWDKKRNAGRVPYTFPTQEIPQDEDL